MKSFGLGSYALSGGIALALLAGCGGPQPPVSAPFSSSTTRLIPVRTRASDTYSVLYSFTGSSGGAYPNGGLLNVDDTLYGTTSGGGRARCVRHQAKLSCGTVFAITTSGAETQLYRFRGQRKDGVSPNEGLIDVAGTLYGTTRKGGAFGRGIVYSIAQSGSETTLHSFGGSGDGVEPVAGLVSLNGILYGTTPDGGAHGDGTVYSITPSGSESVLYSFGAQSGDGTSPGSALVNVKGTLYGTTPSGGSAASCNKGGDCGTVFSITPDGKERVLHDFGGAGDGRYPSGGLIYASGKLYGTTNSGGSSHACYEGCGTVFALTTSGKETVVYSFHPARARRNKDDAAYPYGTLTDMGSVLYGVASDGPCRTSCSTGGTIFAITRSGSQRTLHLFKNASDGIYPNGQLTGVNGVLYGTTSDGGTGSGSCNGGGGACGVVFALFP